MLFLSCTHARTCRQVSLHIGTKSAAKVQAFYVGKHLAGREPGRLSPSHPYFTETTVAVGAASGRAGPTPNGDTASHDKSVPQPSPSPTNGTAANEAPAADASEAPTAGQVITGYLPLRGDFDVEHDNSAELILADMEFNEVGALPLLDVLRHLVSRGCGWCVGAGRRRG